MVSIRLVLVLALIGVVASQGFFTLPTHKNKKSSSLSSSSRPSSGSRSSSSGSRSSSGGSRSSSGGSRSSSSGSRSASGGSRSASGGSRSSSSGSRSASGGSRSSSGGSRSSSSGSRSASATSGSSRTTASSSDSDVHGSLGNTDYHFSFKASRGRKFSGSAARSYCKKLGKGWAAVSINSAAENGFIVNAITSNNAEYIWTSGKRSGGSSWKWGDGSGLTYNDWSHTGHLKIPQPDNRDGNENCLSILNNFYKDGVHWHDVGCSHTKPVICERSM